MIFGDTPLDEAEGAILAHSHRLPGKALKKGRVLTAEDIAALRAAGAETVIAARLEPGEVPEDKAASRLAAAIAGDGMETAAPLHRTLQPDRHCCWCAVLRSGGAGCRQSGR